LLNLTPRSCYKTKINRGKGRKAPTTYGEKKNENVFSIQMEKKEMQNFHIAWRGVRKIQRKEGKKSITADQGGRPLCVGRPR